ncbi:hypothetical protein B0H34DRAFT_799192 [Crassisporium funariophilum]|nr:hypothetical protein B0H34DRAFT_799192 [Crassisporium funariophilum]
MITTFAVVANRNAFAASFNIIRLPKYCMTYVIGVPAVLARELPPSSPSIPTPNVVALSPRGHRDPSSTSLHTYVLRIYIIFATRDSSRKSYPSSAIGDAHDHYNHYNNQRHPPLTPLRTHRARVPTWIGDDFLASFRVGGSGNPETHFRRPTHTSNTVRAYHDHHYN